jgi:hypothetical protein
MLSQRRPQSSVRDLKLPLVHTTCFKNGPTERKVGDPSLVTGDRKPLRMGLGTNPILDTLRGDLIALQCLMKPQ